GARDRVPVERPVVLDVLGSSGIEDLEDVGSASESSDGEAASDDLAEHREVGRDVQELLGTALREPEGDDLVEDEHRSVTGAELSSASKKLGVALMQASGSKHGLQ